MGDKTSTHSNGKRCDFRSRCTERMPSVFAIGDDNDMYLCPMENITPLLSSSVIACMTPSTSGAAVIILTPTTSSPSVSLINQSSVSVRFSAPYKDSNDLIPSGAV